MPAWVDLANNQNWITVGNNPPNHGGPWQMVVGHHGAQVAAAAPPINNGMYYLGDDPPQGAPAAAQGGVGDNNVPHPAHVGIQHYAPKGATVFLSTRSSSEPQDPAYQIEVSLESLGQELEDLEAAKEALSTQVEVLEESCTAIRSHISTLQRVANQLQTSSPKQPQKRRSKTEQLLAAALPVVQPVDHFAEAEEEPVGPELWQQGQG